MQARSTGEHTSPLRMAREARGLSVRQVAARAKIDPTHLSRIERGEKHASVEVLYRLARVLRLIELADQLKPHVNGRP